MQIYVIRHGLSEGNASGVIQGHTDSPLSSTGILQAELLGRYLARENAQPETIYSSPLKRALQTSERITANLNTEAPIVKVVGFKEVDVGGLAGLTLEDAHAKYPKEFAPDVNKWLDFGYFNGESFEQFFDRVSEATKKIVTGWNNLLEDRTVMFVTHAGVMRPLLKTLLDTQSDMMFFTFGNCCTVKIEFRDTRQQARRVIVEVIPINRVAELMDVQLPAAQDDKVGPKM